MPARGAVELVVSFGPTSSPALGTALACARTYADELTERADGSIRASIGLGTDERAYGGAEQLVMMVGGWKTTTLEVDSSPESRWNVVVMLACARQWLRSVGRCGERLLVPGGEPKCWCCPLFDPETLEHPGPGSGIILPLVPDPEALFGTPDGHWPEVPDYPPEDWT